MNAHTDLSAEVKRLNLPISGMTCASCVKRVETAVSKVDGISDVSVNLATESVSLNFNSPGTITEVVRTIEDAGYEVPTTTMTFEIEGMTCASCVKRVEDALKSVDGVIAASVNLATESALVEARGNVDAASLTQAVKKAGYGAKSQLTDANALEQRKAQKDAEYATLKRNLLIAVVFTLPLFVLEMGSHFIPGMHMLLMESVGMRNLYFAYFVMASIVQFGPGMIFYKKGVPALLRFAPEMNSLVVLGSSAAWGYSVVATFLPSLLPAGTANVYFEASAVIITLILLGRLLEARAKGRTSEAITKLMSLQAKSARVLRDGKFVEVSLDEVIAGDIVQVRPGDKVPVDGEVTRGNSFVDEAMISGEPVPVEKSVGSEVIGGTINKTGSFEFRAIKVGADSALAQIIKMVENAQGSKLPIQALVDKVTAVFVPVVMLVALITVGVWLAFGPEPALSFALINGVAVLIIACPCAMGLATPTSIMVGTGRAAEMGVLFRHGEALQELKNTQVVAVDKTGTLTLGRPVLTDFDVTDDFDKAEALALVAAAEANSEHPIAEAIVAAAHEQGLEVPKTSSFDSFTGYGIRAEADGRTVEVGADRFMTKLGHELSAFAEISRRLGREAKTPLYAAIDGKIAAIIAVADPIKETTPKAIDALHALSLKVAMITGDNQETANAIAKKLKIDDVYAEVLPAGKVEVLKQIQAANKRVSFVGDGINDAPALAQADVGIAIGTGTDIAIESADVVLMSGDVQGVANAIALSKATIKNIQQNLFWAFAYNVSLIPVAAGVLYPSTGTLLSPMLAAGAMALSSVFVLGNALRLKRFAV
ncbi:heavy metal translocating P-type ATPase [Maritalea porphyrae]|uniref:Copper-translocating P-type ATPase n=1 Tax=Maritalea porphyrae TaxID=880732 RepID=A0ABQ5UL20_9HYPH|nr:heavy metal translocating P-type ATPase [Maritalea porphyrae]GLQ15919.1 copper-translocating P-type ATPase [Maritalea porphyrae]